MSITVKASSAFSRNGTPSWGNQLITRPGRGIACIDSTGRLLVHGSIGSGTADDPTHRELERYDPSNNTWTTLAASAQYQYDHGWIIDSSDRIIYAAGHVDDGTNRYIGTNRGEIYDPVGNTWSAITAIPGGVGTSSARSAPSFFKDGTGKLNLIAGLRSIQTPYSGFQDGSSSTTSPTDIWQYSGGAAGTWTNIVPTYGTGATAKTARGSESEPPLDLSGKPWGLLGGIASGSSNTLYIYDPGTTTFTAKTALGSSEARGYGSFAALWSSDGLLYVAGGFTQSSFSGATAFNTSWKYDPVGNAWTQLANLPRALGFAALVEFGPSSNYLYLVGGVGDVSAYSPLATITRYDKTANTWTDTADVLSVARLKPAVVKALDGSGYWIYSGQSTAWSGRFSSTGTGGYTNVLEWWVPELPAPTVRPSAWTAVIG